jgi:hypothetical protein
MVSAKLAFFAENPSPGYSLDPPNIYTPSARVFPARLIDAVRVAPLYGTRFLPTFVATRGDL